MTQRMRAWKMKHVCTGCSAPTPQFWRGVFYFLVGDSWKVLFNPPYLLWLEVGQQQSYKIAYLVQPQLPVLLLLAQSCYKQCWPPSLLPPDMPCNFVWCCTTAFAVSSKSNVCQLNYVKSLTGREFSDWLPCARCTHVPIDNFRASISVISVRYLGQEMAYSSFSHLQSCSLLSNVPSLTPWSGAHPSWVHLCGGLIGGRSGGPVSVCLSLCRSRLRAGGTGRTTLTGLHAVQSTFATGQWALLAGRVKHGVCTHCYHWRGHTHGDVWGTGLALRQ